MLEHINEIAQLRDHELQTLTTGAKRHLKYITICSAVIAIGMAGALIALNTWTVWLIAVILSACIAWMLERGRGDIRVAEYEIWRRGLHAAAHGQVSTT